MLSLVKQTGVLRKSVTKGNTLVEALDRKVTDIILLSGASFANGFTMDGRVKC